MNKFFVPTAIFNTFFFNIYHRLKWLPQQHITVLECFKSDYKLIFTSLLYIFMCFHITK